MEPAASATVPAGTAQIDIKVYIIVHSGEAMPAADAGTAVAALPGGGLRRPAAVSAPYPPVHRSDPTTGASLPPATPRCNPPDWAPRTPFERPTLPVYVPQTPPFPPPGTPASPTPQIRMPPRPADPNAAIPLTDILRSQSDDVASASTGSAASRDHAISTDSSTPPASSPAAEVRRNS